MPMPVQLEARHIFQKWKEASN